MTLRTSLEAVLRKHFIVVIEPQHPQTDDLVTQKVSSSLLDDLLACYPQPSRQELHRLLLQCDLYNAITSDNSATIVSEKALDTLMDWATGQESKVWCEHVFLQGDIWFFKTEKDSPFMGCVPNRWKFCPICATPRPADG